MPATPFLAVCFPNMKHSYENFVSGIIDRGMDSFVANGPHIVMDTTDFNKIHIETLIKKINSYREEILHG